MTHGFDIDSPLVCEGIVGDGCGGGRIFYVEGDTLFVYDPLTQERMVLQSSLSGVEKISKKGCDIIIECHNKTIIFNLSLLKITNP
jgi:hypothetical protein